MKAIDLFSGSGGTSLGAQWAGLEVLWAANHNPRVVETHRENHPEVIHLCQDLHQADWSEVPDHNVMLASPCCQGHSNARGKRSRSKQADKSRSTAWAVVSCLEAKQPEFGVVENVPEFASWQLFEPWLDAIKRLGYSVAMHVVNCSTLGVPQSRRRMFMVLARAKNPLWLDLPKHDPVPASSFIDFNMRGYEWFDWRERVPATTKRITQGRRDFGDVFIDTAYGSERTGHSIHKPIGTITTVNKHSLVVGDKIRPLSIKELAAAQTFPSNYKWPEGATISKLMIGNAVPPLAAQRVLEALSSVA